MLFKGEKTVKDDCNKEHIIHVLYAIMIPTLSYTINMH